MYAWCGRINDARITSERLKSSPLFNTLNEKSEWRSLTDLHKAGENTSFPLCLTRRLFPCEACCHGPTARCGPSAWANLKPTGRPQTWSLSPITSAETNPFYLAVAQKQKEKKSECWHLLMLFFKWVSSDGRMTPMRNDAQISVTVPSLFSDKWPGLF